MVNRGYQHDDERIVDYELWRLPGTDLDLRGPKPASMPADYFVALGAAQTFGRFVRMPYVNMLGEQLGMDFLNFGFSGAGPSYFFERPVLMDLINRSKFAIVQVMSGRSVSNSRFVVQANQGVVKPVGAGQKEPWIFAQNAYEDFLKRAPIEEIIRFRSEIKVRYVEETIHLLDQIKVPKILLYWSTRAPEYGDGLETIGRYWGAFPHFVNQEVIDEIRPHADRYVEVVTSRGMPQTLTDRKTGQPFDFWDKKAFSHLTNLRQNAYYPSPEMHEDAAAALGPVVAAPIAAPARLHGHRDVLVHMHIFKNAGSSVDDSLKRHFGEGWTMFDPVTPAVCYGNDDVLDLVRKNPHLRAVSSHQLRFPMTGSADIRFHPVIFLRHPIDRIESIYEWERLEARQRTSSLLHTKMAAKLSFKEYAEWCISTQMTAGPVANYQTRVCSSRHCGHQFADWSIAPNLQNLREALKFLARLPVVGVVEEFARSIDLMSAAYGPLCEGLHLEEVRLNVSRGQKVSLQERLAAIREKLTDGVYRRMLLANALDLELYEAARRRLGLLPVDSSGSA